MADRNTWETSASVYVKDFSDKRMEEFGKAGIKFMELTASNYNDFADFPERAQELFDIAAANGVKIRSVHLPFSPFGEIDPAHLDKSVRDRFTEIQRPIIEAAGKCGIEIAVVHPSGEPYAEDTRPQRLEYAAQSLNAIQKIAEESGVRLAIENLPRTCLGRDCYDMKTLLDAVSGAYACFDSNHSLSCPNTDLIKAMGSRIIATHISDYDFINERHLFPGLGKNDWEAIMSALEEVGYSGTWNYEIKDSGSYTAEVFKLNHNKLLAGTIR